MSRESETQSPRARPWATALGYIGMLSAALISFLWIRAHGETLTASAAGAIAAPEQRGAGAHVLGHVLLALATVIVLARGLGVLFRRLRQPPVIGEVIAGILLGPSLLGRISPDAQAFLLPADAAPYLGILSQLGVILFMFFVGLELDLRELGRRSGATLAISHASIVVPFLLGSALALWLYPPLSSESVGFTNFALFMGVSMSVTAFPVLARLLTDRGMQRSPLGVIALACAAVDDATAWCLLALVVGIVRARADSSLVTFVLSAAYVASMVIIVRPLLAKLSHWHEGTGGPSRAALATALVALLVSALITDTIGIHALFGAFLLGALVPHDSALARELQQFEELVVMLLLPAFFAFTGLRTQMGLLSTPSDWIYCAAIVGVACLGKFGGSALAARLTGFSWSDSTSLGILMNTRGLMEFVVLNVGFELGVISPRLFAMLVVMAVVTTVASGPLLHQMDARQRRRGTSASRFEAPSVGAAG